MNGIFQCQRVFVLGLPGSGKTTFAQGLSSVTGLPHLELDLIYWPIQREDRKSVV